MISRVSCGRLGLITIACAGLLLSGCMRLGAMSRVDPASIAVYPGGARAPGEPSSPEARVNRAHGCGLVRGPYDFSVGAIDLDCFRFPEDWAESDHQLPTREETQTRMVDTITSRVVSQINNQVPSPARRSGLRPLLAYARAATDRVDRNRLTEILMKHSDDICTREMGQITSNEATVNTSLSVLTTGLTTAANIVTGELAGAILTGGANFTSGGRDAINAHVYRNQFAYAISRAITLERQSRREWIEARYTREIDDFTVDQAIRAVNLYHSQCSFYKGLELVLSSVESRENLNRHLGAEARIRERQELERAIAEVRQGLLRLPNSEELKSRLQELTLRLSGMALAQPQPAPGAATEGSTNGSTNGSTDGSGTRPPDPSG